MVKKKEKSLTCIKMKNFFNNNKFGFIFLGVLFLFAWASVLFGGNNLDSIDPNKVYGDDVIEMYYFHLKTCPHCIEQNKFMRNGFFEKYPNIRIHKFDMTNSESFKKYKEMAVNFKGLDNNNFPGTPLTIIGNKTNIGFGSAETTGLKIIDMVEVEMAKINENWDPKTMKRTADLNK